jgi:hypothetical protein
MENIATLLITNFTNCSFAREQSRCGFPAEMGEMDFWNKRTRGEKHTVDAERNI